MAFDGNGNWIPEFSAKEDRDAGVKILASRFDDVFQQDLKVSFEKCLTTDGQNRPLQDFNFNNNKGINVADPETDSDVVNLRKLNNSLNDLLKTLYPVGSLYIGTQNTCPLATLITGSTWVKIEGRYLLTSGTLNGTSETYSATNTVSAGLPDHQHHYAQAASDSGSGYAGAGSFGNWSLTTRKVKEDYPDSIYGESETVRPTAYVVNVWRRTE